MTKWERRPLYRNQLHYAALDAVAVIEIWSWFKEEGRHKKALELMEMRKEEWFEKKKEKR